MFSLPYLPVIASYTHTPSPSPRPGAGLSPSPGPAALLSSSLLTLPRPRQWNQMRVITIDTNLHALRYIDIIGQILPHKPHHLFFFTSQLISHLFFLSIVLLTFSCSVFFSLFFFSLFQYLRRLGRSHDHGRHHRSSIILHHRHHH